MPCWATVNFRTNEQRSVGSTEIFFKWKEHVKTEIDLILSTERALQTQAQTTEGLTEGIVLVMVLNFEGKWAFWLPLFRSPSNWATALYF